MKSNLPSTLTLSGSRIEEQKQAPQSLLHNRRGFLRALSAGSIAVGYGYHSGFAMAQSRSVAEKLNIACIGTANRAAEDIKGVEHENIIALCDVDSNNLQRQAANFPGVKTYADYREMLDREGDRIDAVVVGTTDHHHAPATIRAIRAGKHVYCEKPLTHTVEEARIIALAAKKHGVATQLGTQIHAGDNYRRVVEIVQSGAIGDVTDVHVWVGKGWGLDDRPLEPADAPEHLNWDLWLGPAPVRPFSVGRYHPAQWRRFWNFGQGTLGDMGCHFMDLPFWALNLRYPTEVSAEGPEVHHDQAPNGMIARYKFPARGSMPALNLTWYDSERIPKEIEGNRVPANGVFFIGTGGMMFADYTKYRLFPNDKFSNFAPPAKVIPDSIGHHREWLKACRDGSPTTCNFDYSGALTETVLLGNVAYRSGQKFQWDGPNLKAINCPEAEKYLRKDYRAGWEVTA
ncbi:MAG: Gfo/Idh/MocA family oxidoreductase [Planctomycetales bacterium]|nr:Gfo/Idh/MocA family oxidoreductase [Planctomycetales bacterium]